MKKTIVTGAGIGGLTAALLLAADGHNVLVLESNSKPGGKMNRFEKEGFCFDTGPSLLTMPFVLGELFKRCGRRLEDYLETVPLTPLCRYYYPDGTLFDCFSDRGRMHEELMRVAPEDAAAYSDFLEYSGKLYERTESSFLNNPLYSARDFRSLNFLDMLRIDALATVSRRVDSVFRSEYMRMFFKRFTTYNGSSPYLAPATLNVIPHVELTMGGFYLKGGLYALAEALMNIGREMGVEYRFNTPVERITGANGRVQGVLTQSGETLKADAVFSNSDAAETYQRLLGGGIEDKKMKRKTAAAEPSCSGFVLLLGCDRKWDELAHHTIFFSSDYRREFDDLFVRIIPSDDPTIYVANTSVHDPDHAPGGMSNLFVLVNAPYLNGKTDWTATGQRYADRIIEILGNRGLNGLKNSVRVREIITPADFYDRYRSNKGSIYGTSSNNRLSAFRRPRNKSRTIEGLYLTGGSVHPGGGIPLTVLSARHAVELFRRFSG
jgi:phytoene desaturase